MRPLLSILCVLCLGAGLAVAQPDDPKTKTADPIVGEWHILTQLRGQEMTSKLTIRRTETGTLEGTYVDSRGGTSELESLVFEAGKLSFKRQAGPGTIRFEGTVEGDRIKGHHLMRGQEIPALAVRGKQAFEAMQAARRKANERSDDLEADYEKNAHQVMPRDSFPVLFDPKLAAAKDADDIREDEPVIGVVVGDEAQAYPISIMGVHELVNTSCGGQPIAASW